MLLDQERLTKPFEVPSIDERADSERNAWWFEPTEVRCRKLARVYRKIAKVKNN